VAHFRLHIIYRCCSNETRCQYLRQYNTTAQNHDLLYKRNVRIIQENRSTYSQREIIVEKCLRNLIVVLSFSNNQETKKTIGFPKPSIPIWSTTIVTQNEGIIFNHFRDLSIHTVEFLPLPCFLFYRRGELRPISSIRSHCYTLESKDTKFNADYDKPYQY